MTDITLPRAELKRALEALEQMYKRAASPDTLEASDRDLQNIADNPMSGEVASEAQEVLFIRAAITALRDRLAQPEQDVPATCFGNMVPVGWLESPDGVFRANPLYKNQFPSSLLSWQVPLYTTPPQRKPLTPREIELLEGMIEVQLHHAAQCDLIANRVMADKQKGWDMERVELLRKLKEKNT